MRTHCVDSVDAVSDDELEVTDATITAVADLVGDKWSMLVVRDVFRGVRRFDDLCADLGVARAVLADAVEAARRVGRADEGRRTRSAPSATSTA